MKIICIGRNYSEHAKELKNEVPTTPVFFMKPDTALLKDNAPFYYPTFSNEIHYEVELVIKISKNGKTIAPQFAHKYYEQITVGIDFTARDLQQQCKEKGLPWEKAKAFDNSAVIGRFIQIIGTQK
jgi:acylpyruvate hydrolase